MRAVVRRASVRATPLWCPSRLATPGRPRQRMVPTDPLSASLLDSNPGTSPGGDSGNRARSLAQEALRVVSGPTPVFTTAPRAESEAVRLSVQALDDTRQARIAAQQAALMAVDIAELVARVQHYLSATARVQLVSAEEEHVLFPVVNHRFQELSVDQMLDIVSSHWARSTLLRYGTALKDRIRDRIAIVAAHAGQQLQQSAARRTDPLIAQEEEDAQEAASTHDGTHDTDEPTGAVVVGENDPVLANAAAVMDAATVLRCLTVMGLSAGRRKRDVAFFQIIGAFVVFHINRYHDSMDLVRALSALSRAKVVPPESFLALIARRLPVLHKNTPLSPLNAYRVMVNLSRMGHKHMNVYRFLADSMLRTIQANLAEASLAGRVPSKDELERLMGLRPSMFTKWLCVLGLSGAPHQQYLRPLVAPLLVPALPALAPPSFSRLLVATYRFRSTDADLLEPLLRYATECLAPAGQLRRTDALTLLRILTVLTDESPPSNVVAFFTALRATFGAASATDVVAERRVMRPSDMCVVAQCVARYQTRSAMSLENIDPLLGLLGDFAQRLGEWMVLGVVSLGHVDEFLSLCVHNIVHPDTGGHLARLQALRKQVDDTTEYADASEGQRTSTALRDYDAKVDIDVRNVFDGLTLVNDAASAYGGFRPIPGPLLVDFRELLARCSALDIMLAVDLFARSCPGALGSSAKLVVTRSVLAKLTQAGEEVLSGDGRELQLRPPQPLVLTRDDLTRLVALLHRSPLDGVRASEAVWAILRSKAAQLGMPPTTIEDVTQRP